MPPRAKKPQLTSPFVITSDSFLIGRRRILVIPRNHLEGLLGVNCARFWKRNASFLFCAMCEIYFPNTTLVFLDTRKTYCVVMKALNGSDLLDANLVNDTENIFRSDFYLYHFYLAVLASWEHSSSSKFTSCWISIQSTVFSRRCSQYF